MIKEANHLVYRLSKRNGKKMAYRGKDYPTTFSIPTECVVFSEDDGRPVQLRYVMGEPDLLRANQRKDQKKAPSIKFSEGFLTVNKNEKTLIEYLSLVGWNKAVEEKQHRQVTLFELVDAGATAEDEFEKREVSGQATTLFWNTYNENPDKIKAVAFHFGINLDNHKWRTNILSFLEKEPVKFRNLLESKETMAHVERKYNIKLASERGILTFANSRWSWTGGSPIFSVVLGESPYKALADFTFSGKEGLGMWEAIDNRLNPDKAKKKEEPKISPLDLLTYEELLDKAKSLDVIEWDTKKRKFFLHYKDGSESLEIAKSAKAVLARMEADDLFVAAIKSELS